MGSVKDINILEAPSGTKEGRGIFRFSDRYSVFDWGEMPDQIPHKGEAIAILAGYLFERMEEMGIPSHYIGLRDNGRTLRLKDLTAPTREMEVRFFRVIRPDEKDGSYNYSIYKQEHGNFLIPLEIIYRNSLPEGSSVFKRIASGEVSYKDLGFSDPPSPGAILNPPMVDFSTKLEVTDRYLKEKEASEIAGLTKDEVSNIKELVIKIDRFITSEFERVGLVNEDGKIEVAFDSKRRLVVVDVVGTLDECRFTYEGIPISKEIARLYYRKTNWYKDVLAAKEEDRVNWKKICKSVPEHLPSPLLDAISSIYMACTNEITGRDWFKGVKGLSTLIETVREYIN